MMCQVDFFMQLSKEKCILELFSMIIDGKMHVYNTMQNNHPSTCLNFIHPIKFHLLHITFIKKK